MNVYGVIPAAGVGKRFGSEIPKQYQFLAGKTILEHSILRLQACKKISSIWIALNQDDRHWVGLDTGLRESVQIVTGGAQRADSVRHAINAISEAESGDWVLVHDSVRPVLNPSIVAGLIDSLSGDEAGAILAMPIDETVKQAHADQTVSATLDRSSLWTAQTPQIFRFELLSDALERTKGDDRVTDEASAMEACGYSVRLHEGHRNNIKITRREDLLLAEQLIKLEAQGK